MLRHALVLVPLLSVGCASTRTNELILGDAIDANVIDARTSAPSADSIPSEPGAEIRRELSAPSITPPQDEGGLHENRLTLKAGYYGSTEDELDDGYIFGVSWTRFLNKLFAVELELGYLDMDGDDAGVETDVWSVPVMLNGRVNVPVWILEGYGGLGIGTFYYDAEASGAVSADEDGFLFGGNAFVGASLNLADALALGLELKYYVTDDISSDIEAGLDAYALMLTLGWRR